MPRVPRVDVGGEIYHVINRANARLSISFFKYHLYEVCHKKNKESTLV